MARYNKFTAPYYDDYDSSKHYTQLLAIPGRVAQAREITQIQSVVKDIIKGIGDSIMKNGNIIEGCQVFINKEKTEAVISAGKVYLDGMVLNVKETKLAITGTGTEVIGVKLMEYLITESEDNTLRDPAQGYDNFNQPGCHRVKSEAAIVKDDPEAATITVLIDGEISVEHYAPEYDAITETLARRTYDESGSYIVNGLKVRVEAHPTDTSKLLVVVEAGKAYVLGYELKIPAARRITIDRALKYTTINRRTTYNGEDYTLSSGEYVQSILNVEGTKKHINSIMSAPTYNTEAQQIVLPTDAVGFDSIISAVSGSTTYVMGTDYELVLEGSLAYIKWKGTDNYPTSTYTLTYNYIAKFTAGTDYELATQNGHHVLHWISGGSHPETGLYLGIEYNQYLARKDVVYLDQLGNIDVILGIPSEYGLEVAPEAPVNTLSLAQLWHPPGGSVSTITVSNIGLTRFTMNDIQNLLSRVRNIEYDQAVLSLQDDSRQRTVDGTRKSIFTDPLIDFSKVDYYYNLVDGAQYNEDLPIYDATIDFDSNICYLPTKAKTYDMSYNSSTGVSTIRKYTRLATLSKTGETIVISQMNATKAFQINPYSAFPEIPEIALTPAVDSWIESSVINVPVSKNASEVVSASTRHVEMSTSGISHTSSSTRDTTIGTKVSTTTTESVIKEESITYVRSKEIQVTGSKFPANLDNIKCYFDGVLLPIYPTGTTQSGTDSVTGADISLGTGSIKSNSKGELTAKFTIPTGKFLTGIREVRLETSVPGYDVEGQASALYQATGVSRTIQRTVTTLTTVLLERVTTTTTWVSDNLDPVGQTFVLDKMTIISGIDLYFASKPTVDVSVDCDIREVSNGTITSTILASKTLSAAEVKVSSDSKTATRFAFDDPVILEANKEYAFVVRSTSTDYRIWIADLGESDIITGDLVLNNPYLIGIMLSSSNNSSWTNHQTSDVKFRLIADNYSTNSDLIMNNISATDEFSRIYFLAESIIPQGTSIDWYYSTDSGTTFSPISPYNIKLLDSMKSNLLVKATLTRQSTTSQNLSPIIALDSINAVLSSYDTSGYYISTEFPGNTYTHVKIVLDTYIPYNSVSLKVYVSADNGENMVEATVASTSNLNYGWVERTYTAQMSSSSTVCKIFIKMESSYQYQTPAFGRLRAITYTT